MTSGAFFLIVQTVNVKASLAFLMGFSIGMNETEGEDPVVEMIEAMSSFFLLL